MEIAKKEIEMVKAAADKAQGEIQELGELQLALVGGGYGDPIAA